MLLAPRHLGSWSGQSFPNIAKFKTICFTLDLFFHFLDISKPNTICTCENIYESLRISIRFFQNKNISVNLPEIQFLTNEFKYCFEYLHVEE